MPKFTFHLGDPMSPRGYQLYCDPTGGCLLDDLADRAIVFDGPLHVSRLEMTQEQFHVNALGALRPNAYSGAQRTTLEAQVLGRTRILPAAQAKATIGALANASIPELLAALNQRMDDRAAGGGGES